MALSYYYLDVETTGFSENIHELTQVSIIRGADKVQFSRHIKPRYPERCSQQALDATKRTRQDLQKGSAIEMVGKELFDWIETDGLTPEHRCCVIHSKTGFDRRFIHVAFNQINLIFPITIWFDTEAATRDYFNRKGWKKESVRLTNCIEKLGITMKGDYHNAIIDARATYKLHQHLLNEGIDHLKYIKREPQKTKA